MRHLNQPLRKKIFWGRIMFFVLIVAYAIFVAGLLILFSEFMINFVNLSKP